MKLYQKTLAVAALAVAAAGCRPAPVLEENLPEAEGYTVMFHYGSDDKDRSETRIGEFVGEGKGFSRVIYALDINGDCKPERISLQNLDSGLEKLASAEKITEICKAMDKKHR